MTTRTKRTARLATLAVLGAALAATPALANTSEAFGQVLDLEGNPVKDVRVIFAPASNPTIEYDGVTNKKGRYFVVGMFSPQGDDWNVRVEADGLVPVEMTVESRTVNRVLIGDVRTRKLQPGQDIPTVVIRQLGKLQLDLVVASEEAARSAAVAEAAPAEGADEPAARAPQSQAKDPWDEALDIAAQGDLEGAVPLFEKAIDKKPDDAERHEAYAKVLYQLEDFDAADAAIGRALELEPESVSALMVRYGIEVGREDFAAAAVTLDRAHELEPDNLAVLEQRAYVAGELGDGAAVEAAYRAMTEVDPENAKAWVALGDIYARSGRTAESEAAYQKVVELEPDTAHQVFFNLGALIMNKASRTDEETQKAIASFRKAIEIKPDYAQAHKQLAFALLGVGDRAGAGKALAEYVELSPDAPDAAQMAALVDSLQ